MTGGEQSIYVYDLLIKIVVPIVQVLVVVIGWNVVSRGNDKREKRKELRTLLNEVRSVAFDIEREASEYYQLEPSKSKELATSLKRQLKSMSMFIVTITRLNAIFDLSRELFLFREKVTGQDFESATRIPRKDNDALFGEISLAANSLIDEMETIFCKQYA